MRNIVIAATLMFSVFTSAQEKLHFNFSNEEITKVIELYAKASGTRFVVDSTVRGKITLLNSTPITIEESYNQLSETLKLNGFAIVKKADYSTVRNARSAQRDGIEVSSTLPSLRPEKMTTWIVTLKNISADEFKNRLGRMMTSMYGEFESVSASNQLIITDFTSSLHRIADIIKEADVVSDPKLSKLIDQNKANRLKQTEEFKKKKVEVQKDEETK